MSEDLSTEFIRCSICNKIVPKQQYCPKCGKLLIKNYKSPAQKKEATKSKQRIEDDAESTPEQLENLRDNVKIMEIERKKALEQELKEENQRVEDEIDEEKKGEDTMVKSLESKDIVLDDGVKLVDIDLEDKFEFTPDKYTMDTVQRLTKNIRYQSQLVKMLSDKEMNEETFLGLYKGKAEDTHRLIARRSEIIRDVDSSLGGYENIIKVAEQGMKLLDIRMSIDDVSEEEYKVKAAAFKWDIDHYNNKIKTEEAKANYLRNLGTLIEAEELETIVEDLNDCMDMASKLSVSEETKGKIQSSMKEVLILLRETSSN